MTPQPPAGAPERGLPGAGAPALLGIDIGGTKTAAVLFDDAHRALARTQAPTPAAKGADAVAANALDLAADLLTGAERRGLRVRALGIGTAGVVGPDGRDVRAATDALPGWAGTPLARLAEDRLGPPTRLLGDVQAFLAGELAAGAAAGADSAVAVMAGTGIGGAVAVGGRVRLGAHGAAGHLGHVPSAAAATRTCPCGASGHVEAVAAGPAMTDRFRQETGRRAEDLRDVAAHAAAGDDRARLILTEGGAALGEALAGVVGALDPDLIVVDGGVLDSGPWYLDALRAAVAAHALPLLRDVPVVRAVLGADAVALGAAVHAVTRLADPPAPAG